jgi:hypothetical protein
LLGHKILLPGVLERQVVRVRNKVQERLWKALSEYTKLF